MTMTTIASPPLNDIPGPPPTRLLGSRGNLIRFMRDPLAYIVRLHRDYGPIVSFVKGRRGIVFGFGPEFNQLVLNTPRLFEATGLTIPGPADSAQRRIGHSLFTMNGEKHAQQRRFIMPAFHKQALDSYHQEMVKITEDMLVAWRGRSRVSIYHEMKQLTERVTLKVLFGLDQYERAYQIGDLMAQWVTLSTSFSVRLMPNDYPGFPYHRMMKKARRIEQKIIDLIAEKRAAGASGNDVMSLLLRAHDEQGERMSDEELIGQTNVLFAAGHETTSNALMWTLFLLAQHPQVMHDLHDELHKKLNGAPPGVDQLQSLPLLERVIKESLRVLAPPVYNTRRSLEPFELGPYSMPARSTIGFSHYVTHHMPELYPNPNRFDPSRWETIKPSPYEYLPFGAGPHACIGSQFAMMEMKIVLAMILQRYRLTVVPRIVVDRQVAITMSVRGELPMFVQPQDGQFVKSPVRGNIHEMVDLI